MQKSFQYGNVTMIHLIIIKFYFIKLLYNKTGNFFVAIVECLLHYPRAREGAGRVGAG